jgi:adenosylcobinamide-GDP ribazoletransferase
VWPAGIAVLLSMAATLLATGAFHKDGLADSCDAFGGGYTREDIFRIMRDSRIGAFGAITLVIALALKWQALATLPPARAAWAMVAAHAASRALAISIPLGLDCAREDGKARPVARALSWRGALLAAASGLPWLCGFGWRFACATLAALALLRTGALRYLRRRLGGYTGDCLGAVQQLAELAIYLMVCAWNLP